MFSVYNVHIIQDMNFCVELSAIIIWKTNNIRCTRENNSLSEIPKYQSGYYT